MADELRITDHYNPTRSVVVEAGDVAQTIAHWYADASEPEVITDRLARLQEAYVRGEDAGHLEAVLGLDVIRTV